MGHSSFPRSHRSSCDGVRQAASIPRDTPSSLCPPPRDLELCQLLTHCLYENNFFTDSSTRPVIRTTFASAFRYNARTVDEALCTRDSCLSIRRGYISILSRANSDGDNDPSSAGKMNDKLLPADQLSVITHDSAKQPTTTHAKQTRRPVNTSQDS